MSDLLWPGDHRAGELFTDARFVAAMVRVEAAWLAALHGQGIAQTENDLHDLVGEGDLPALARAAEDGGNPVIPLLALLRDRLAEAELPIQLGGAAGSLAAPTAIAGSPQMAAELVAATAAALGLAASEPWHTSRTPVARVGDALVSCTDAWGRIANDVLAGARPEVHELAESPVEGRGGSSAMPNKRNPVLAVLLRRAALAGPPLAATLHAAAANAVDERPDGSWHVEWPTLRTLARHTVAAGSQAAELLAGLRVDTGRMAGNLAAARPDIDAEQRKYGADGPYLGATDRIVDAALARAGAKPC